MSIKDCSADILIKNGRVIDGTGCPAYHANVVIKNGIITEIGKVREVSAKMVIDATGKYVTPGFIDSHSHSDRTIFANPLAQSSIRQGVTTEIVGLCGTSAAPMTAEAREKGAGGFGGSKGFGQPLGSFRHFLDTLDKIGISENLVWYVGHNTLRTIAGIDGAEYTEDQFQIMERLLRESLEAGACGMSTGLEFSPGRNATNEEIMRLVSIVKEFDAIYATHQRNRDSKILEAVDEFLNVIRKNQIRGILSHLNIRYNTGAPKNAWEDAVAMVEDARNQGLDIQTDNGYIDYGIGQLSAILPEWIREGGWQKTVERLADCKVRKKLRTDCDRYWRFIHRGEWHRVAILSNPGYPEVNGLTFPEISKKWRKDEWDCLFDIFKAAGSGIDRVIALGQTFTEEHMFKTLKHPLYSYIVDGYTADIGTPLSEQTKSALHYIGIIRLFTVLVREKKWFTIEEAVRKVTTMPAGFYRLFDRGIIRIGCAADINVFALENLKANATREKPCVYSEGFDYVIVNGVPVISAGDHTGARPGKNLRF